MENQTEQKLPKSPDLNNMNQVEIVVNQISGKPNFTFDVSVNEEISSTKHLVTMEKDFFKELKTEVYPVNIVEESFKFLLSKEPKEMIYSKFDVSIISRYYPDFLDYLNENV